MKKGKIGVLTFTQSQKKIKMNSTIALKAYSFSREQSHMEVKQTKAQIEQLVRQAQNGNEQGFEALFTLFSEKIQRYISHRVPEEQVEDLLSETWLRVVENLENYQSKANAGFSSWIFRIAHNLVVDFYRKRQEVAPLEGENEENEPYYLQIEDESNPHPDTLTNLKLDTERLLIVLKDMPTLQREILELRFLEGLSTLETAEVVGKSDGNVRVIQLRALRELKQKLSE